MPTNPEPDTRDYRPLLEQLGAPVTPLQESQPTDPFDPRTEVSADAKKIVMHLWIILVGLPTIVLVLYFLWHA